jgi:hypothetical protein
VGEITESDLHEVADKLLREGESNEPLILLFALERDELRWAGADAFESLLREWGGGSLHQDEAVDIVLRDLAAGVVAGTVTPSESTGRAHAIDVRTGYQHASLSKWRGLYEELGYLDSSGSSYLGRSRAAIEADVLKLARSLLEGRS